MLDQKNFGGYVAIEIDISKYFYTLDWSFLIELWFSHFCSWIFTIVHSGKLSFVMNGKNVGVLNCKRGVLNCMTLCYDFLSRKYKKFGSYYVFAQSSWRYLWSSTLVLTNGNSSLVYDYPKEAQYHCHSWGSEGDLPFTYLCWFEKDSVVSHSIIVYLTDLHLD